MKMIPLPEHGDRVILRDTSEGKVTVTVESPSYCFEDDNWQVYVSDVMGVEDDYANVTWNYTAAAWREV